MNNSSVSLILNTCLKLDRGFRQIQLCTLRAGNKVDHQSLFGYIHNSSRLFNTAQILGEAQKDGITVLPSPQEVTVILRKNEYNKEFSCGSVKSYDSNQLASNDPIEDTRSEALCKLTTGILMGVFDGHGGPACAQVISKRLLKYVAAALLPMDSLNKFIKEPEGSLVEILNDRVQVSSDSVVCHSSWSATWNQIRHPSSKQQNSTIVFHGHVCISCGKSLLRIRSHTLFGSDSPCEELIRNEIAY